MYGHHQYQPAQHAYPQWNTQGWPPRREYPPPTSSRPSGPYYQPAPQGQVLFLNRHSDESTLSLRAADGRPLYSCIATHSSSLSVKPDYVITQGASNRGVGAIRYHRWTETGLDYWAVRGVPSGAGLWDWRVAALDAHRAQCTCYSRRAPPSPAAAAVVARLDFDCDARKPGGAVGRCELYDGWLLASPARQHEMDELFVTAVVAVQATLRTMAQTKERHGAIRDWGRLAKALDALAQAGGHGGADGGGGDGNGGDGGGGGGGDGSGGGGGGDGGGGAAAA
ncbi:hypothetical protein F4809DRAFT_660552 [Biscogniauxia mediterranea]|nr:hypothetical protein F4809DRAFT_660552 [Biscogniauxia mediterranea]